MTYARKTLISLGETPYYHVVARCVRRAWLWGKDEYAGRDYSHRKKWVVGRIKQLTSVFAIDVCAYAVMSNHYHLVVFVDVSKAEAWTPEEVIRRWTMLFSLPSVVDRWQRGEGTEAEHGVAREMVDCWRKRLADVSWFMRELNEHLARRANEEDGCKGRFWEGRFRSQALLDEAGLLTAMAYVDLNPVRAGVADRPEQSDFTSIQQRIRALASAGECSQAAHDEAILLRGFRTPEDPGRLPFTVEDYLQLVDWTGRAVRADQSGAVDPALPPVLTRLGIDALAWQQTMRPNGSAFGRAMGRTNRLRQHARALGQSWVRGLNEAGRLYRSV